MRLLIKQRLFAWTDTFDIYDENEEQKYYCKGQMFSFGHKLHVYDKIGAEVGYVEQELFHLMPTFNVYIRGKYVGQVKKRFTLFSQSYDLEYNNWQVEGGMLGWDYDVRENDNLIMQISKELLHWGDTYVINILRDEDELMGLMLALAIDAAICTQKNNQ